MKKIVLIVSVFTLSIGGLSLQPTQSFAQLSTVIKKNNFLKAGQTLSGNQRLTSDNGKFILRMQEDDGHLCVYKFENGKQGAFVWGNGVHGFKNSKLILQKDGNLVVYQGDEAKWSSKTHPFFNSKFSNASLKPEALVLGNDGRLYLHSASGNVVWSN
ncbi:MAG TPA: hypothetical protein PKX92_05165 [Edaphocola sp.]|nr:hypothetical protein [Edaphocola sp.]